MIVRRANTAKSPPSGWWIIRTSCILRMILQYRWTWGKSCRSYLSWMPTYIDVVFPPFPMEPWGSPHLFACLPLGYNEIPIFPWPQISRNWRWFESVPWPAVKVTDGTHEMPWEYPEKTMDHWTIGFWATQSYPNLQSPISYAKIPRGVAGCDFLLRWRRPIPRSLFGPDRPCLLFEAGLYERLYAVHHGGFQPFPWIVAFFWGMLYSYTYILEVKLLAGPKELGTTGCNNIICKYIYIHTIWIPAWSTSNGTMHKRLYSRAMNMWIGWRLWQTYATCIL